MLQALVGCYNTVVQPTLASPTPLGGEQGKKGMFPWRFIPQAARRSPAPLLALVRKGMLESVVARARPAALPGQI
jgi:hypothetical protein